MLFEIEILFMDYVNIKSHRKITSIVQFKLYIELIFNKKEMNKSNGVKLIHE